VPLKKSAKNSGHYSAEFKARVALEVLSGAHTISELASKHKVHPNMIEQWKRKAQESVHELFAKKNELQAG
jgi:transposase